MAGNIQGSLGMDEDSRPKKDRRASEGRGGRGEEEEDVTDKAYQVSCQCLSPQNRLSLIQASKLKNSRHSHCNKIECYGTPNESAAVQTQI